MRQRFKDFDDATFSGEPFSVLDEVPSQMVETNGRHTEQYPPFSSVPKNPHFPTQFIIDDGNKKN
jgi:hypothetical protein